MSSLQLVLFAEGRCLTAVVCRRGLRHVAIETVQRTTLEVPPCDEAAAGALQKGLEDLRLACTAAGAGQAWRDTVLLCLGSGDVLFREWLLPGSSRRLAQKSLKLLLEGEFPGETQPLRDQTLFLPEKGREGRGLRALTILFPENALALWRTVLEGMGFSACRLTAAPWPVLAGIPRGTGPALLLHSLGGASCLAVLGEKGRPVRLHALAGGPLPGLSADGGAKEPDPAALAARLHREASLLLEGLAMEPGRLVVYGDGTDSPAFLAALEEAFALPVSVPGRDFPLFGHNARIGESDMHRLAAASLVRACQPRPFCPPLLPLLALPLQGTAWQRQVRQYLPVAAGLVILCLGLAATRVVETLNQAEQAARLRASMQEDLRRALPDAPRGANASRLRSILRSRMKEMQNRQGAVQDYATVRFLERLHALTPPAIRVDIARLSLNAEQCRLQGSAASFDDINSLREALSRMEGVGSARVVSATSRMDERGQAPRQAGRGGVDFELVLGREGS